MKEFSKKLAGKISAKIPHLTPTSTSSAHIPAQSTFVAGSPSPEQEIFRYRKLRGVNLGSWFVQERWICHGTFQSAHPPGQSDLDIARGSNAKEIFEKHWDQWITESDWEWISQHGFNSVRIPIGYYHICGIDPTILDGTDFQGYDDVFAGAWSRLTRAIEIAYRYGIGVLIDLHAAPGKQNRDSHAGTSNPPQFFEKKHHRSHATQVLYSLVANLVVFAHSHSPPLPNVIGVELLNEPQPASDSSLMEWYTSTLKELRQIDPLLPIYLGDCWRPDQYADYITSVSQVTGLVVMDHHLYRCFTSSDISTSAAEHSRNLEDPNAHTPQTFQRVSEKLGRANGGLIVGEWSAALNPGSLRGENDEAKKYVIAQLDLYERTCAGWFFWTLKKQSRGDTGWSLIDAVSGGVFPARVGLSVKRRPSGDEERRKRAKTAMLNQALENHTSYWSKHPGHYEHWRFEKGFKDAWEEAYRFFDWGVLSGRVSVSELGFVSARARSLAGDLGGNYWEYEHGFIQGVGCARNDFQQVYC
ncbi:glycoside hydrolase family 5 protein [Amanita thiersii Skay4041]|uniref:Glycoside hydrolase family 5 protein n=1 Tax=Amanita thiersii Skay4041 TaxID=703135 RepID=A0A2A9NFZ1_9AGAR|nr:glycoside hydrolase family 5 protein [Amanita thiersii Skay4041]